MESTTPFTHSHRHASQLAYDPSAQVDAPPRYWHHSSHYLADQHRPVPPQTRAVYKPHHALFPPPLQARGGKEAPDRGRGPDISTQVRRDQLSPRVVRAVRWGASSLNSTILLWFVM